MPAAKQITQVPGQRDLFGKPVSGEPLPLALLTPAERSTADAAAGPAATSKGKRMGTGKGKGGKGSGKGEAVIDGKGSGESSDVPMAGRRSRRNAKSKAKAKAKRKGKGMVWGRAYMASRPCPAGQLFPPGPAGHSCFRCFVLETAYP